jgi:mannose-1-phosphate guanylyltransferase
VQHVVLATGYRAELFARYLGDGSALGVSLDCAVETEPLGTGGAIRHASVLLRESGPVLVLNGDVLGGLDLRSLAAHHERTDAEVTLHLRSVEDPRAYGVVSTDGQGRVQRFEEKSPRPSGRLVNAGTYVFSRAALQAIPSGRPVSVERETFPGLIEAGRRVVGLRDDDSYWLDVGTPAAYVRANCDIVCGVAPSHRRDRAGGGTADGYLVMPGAAVAASASLSGGTVVGAGAVVGEGAAVHGSVLFEDARIGAGARVTGSVVGRGARLGNGVVLEGAVVADDVQVPSRS